MTHEFTEPAAPAAPEAVEDLQETEDVQEAEADETRSDFERAEESEESEESDEPDHDDEADQEADDEADEDAAEPTSDRTTQLEREGDIAADYLEELLDIADLDGDIDMDVEGDRAAVSVVGGDLGQLVGRSGEVLDALQELTRLAVYRETGERSRLMLDIGGFRAEKRSRLVALAEETVAEVKESGAPVPLNPMTPFERKVVHDAVAAAGLVSDSEGAEPKRYVVVRPA